MCDSEQRNSGCGKKGEPSYAKLPKLYYVDSIECLESSLGPVSPTLLNV